MPESDLKREQVKREISEGNSRQIERGIWVFQSAVCAEDCQSGY